MKTNIPRFKNKNKFKLRQFLLNPKRRRKKKKFYEYLGHDNLRYSGIMKKR